MSDLVRPEGYITIQGWMITDLDLKGIDLLIYAVIYGFSQDKDSSFEGSRNYLKAWSGARSIRTVDTSLASLIERKLITKNTIKLYEGVVKNSYKAVIPPPKS